MAEISAKGLEIIAQQGYVRIGDLAPNFTQDSTQGKINFHEYIEGKWAILFSHPRSKTPVCSTELAQVAKLKAEWEARNTVVLGLAVDTVEENNAWIPDINAFGKTSVTFPIIADADYTVAKAYSMVDQLHVVDGMPVTARSVFIINPSKRIGAMITYPASAGRNFTEILRILDALQLTASHSVATPANWQKGDDVVVLPTISTEDAKKIFDGKVTEVTPYLRFTPDPKNSKQ